MSSQVDKLQESITSQVNSKLGLASNSSTVSKSIQSLTDSISSPSNKLNQTVTSAASDAGNLLKGGVSSLTSSVSDFANSVFAKTTNASQALANRSQSQNKGEQETNSKIKSLASDSAEAISKPVAYVTKSVDDVVTGASTLSQGNGVKDGISSMSETAKNNLSKATGTDINTDSALTSAIKSVTNGFSSAVKGGSDAINSMKEKIVSPTVSTIKDNVSSFTDGIKETVGSIGDTLDIGGTASGLKDLNKTVLDTLPSTVADMISSKEDDFINKTVDSVTQGKMDQISNILSALNGVSSDDVLNSTLGLLSNKYPNITDSEGLDVTKLAGNQSMDVVQRLFSAAQGICNINSLNDTYLNYSDNKTLYDTLLDLAGQYGVTQLIDDLSQCGKNSSAHYFDQQSIDTLRNVCKTATENGDPFTYRSAQNAAGKSNINTDAEDLIKLNANMVDDGYDNTKAYNEILKDAGTSVQQLITANTVGNNTILDSTKVTVMCASNNSVVDNAISTDNRTLIQQSRVLYNQS